MKTRTKAHAEITTAFGSAQTEKFARAAIAEAREAMRGGWSWVTPTVQDSVVESCVLSIALRWDNDTTIAVSAVGPIVVRAMEILSAERKAGTA